MDSIVKKHQAVYPNDHGDFWLMIDIKTPAEQTFNALEQLLHRYMHLINTPLDTADDDHAVRIFLSGNRPVKRIVEHPNPPVALDGRPAELDADFPALLMPVVSEHFGRFNPYTSRGKINPRKEARLISHINQVHRQGKKVRFWAHPDHPDTWAYLLSLGVDLINSDRLEALDAFLTDRGL